MWKQKTATVHPSSSHVFIHHLANPFTRASNPTRRVVLAPEFRNMLPDLPQRVSVPLELAQRHRIPRPRALPAQLDVHGSDVGDELPQNRAGAHGAYLDRMPCAFAHAACKAFAASGLEEVGEKPLGFGLASPAACAVEEVEDLFVQGCEALQDGLVVCVGLLHALGRGLDFLDGEVDFFDVRLGVFLASLGGVHLFEKARFEVSKHVHNVFNRSTFWICVPPGLADDGPFVLEAVQLVAGHDHQF